MVGGDSRSYPLVRLRRRREPKHRANGGFRAWSFDLEAVREGSGCGQPATHRGVDEGVARRAEALVLPGQPPGWRRPAGRPLRQTPLRQDPGKTFDRGRQPHPLDAHGAPIAQVADGPLLTARMRRVARDLDRPATLRLDLRLAAAGVALVCPQVVQPREDHMHRVEDVRCRGTVRQVSGLELAVPQPSAVSFPGRPAETYPPWAVQRLCTSPVAVAFRRRRLV
jgi:hypothetical protein